METITYLQEHHVGSWLLIFVGAVILTLVLKGVLHFVLGRLQKLAGATSGRWDDIIVTAFAGTKTWALFVWVFVPLVHTLHVHESVPKAARSVAVIVTILQATIWGLRAIRQWRHKYLFERNPADMKGATDTSSIAAISLLATVLQGLLIVLAILLALSNMGIDVMALVAGLGVGGIAVALAAQNILGDILASLSIVLDKPFVVGDFIVVGDKMGTVETIGIKTTRLRSLSGEQLIFSNKDLLESRVQNFKRMYERRVVQKIGVVYSTPAEKIQQIPKWFKEFIDADPLLRFDRSHFSGLGASSIDFEFVFFVKSDQFNEYMDHQQDLLLKIVNKFAAEGVEFAYPTQTVYVSHLNSPNEISSPPPARP